MKKSMIVGMVILLSLGSVLFTGCAAPIKEHHKQDYAKYASSRVYEYEFAQVWKAIEASFRNHKVVQRNPKEVDALELKRLTRRTLETDWVNGQSRDRYVNYTVNGAVKRKLLQMRHKFILTAETVIGGVKVNVEMKEEIELLREDGTPAGFEASDEGDSGRIHELLNQIQNQVLAAAP
jgi:hypothetical protein